MNQLLPLTKQDSNPEGATRATGLVRRPFDSGASLERSIVDLYQVVDALREGERSYIIQFIAPHSGAGTSTVASGFAAAVAAVSRRPALYVDVGGVSDKGGERTDLMTAFREMMPLSTAEVPARGAENLLWAKFAPSGMRGAPLSGEDIRQLFDALRDMHPVIVLDCPSLQESPQSVALARYADGTVIVTVAEQTSKAQIMATRQEIERVGGQILGAAFNKRRSYLPNWLRRRL